MRNIAILIRTILGSFLVRNIVILILQHDEYGVYRDEDGNAHTLDVRIINVSKEDIEAILEMADSAEGKYMSLPQYERCFHLPRVLHPIHYPPPSSYNKDNIEELLNNISISRRKMFDEFYEKIDDVYFPLVNPIAGLESRMKELKLKVDLAHKTIHMQQLEVT
ncbi:hypothetical protein F2Q70_00021716 [Brassica cretica]|uniref:Uncharacterized protein n=2 Tax=Brassica cretica TaxID=69181 RepID=A0A3N6QBW4_BRACR|nr:hypothetical protein F2Q70_00021716 [Brassica cretica]KAF2554877.1 hypothetical protein F2Q68_00015401 [Brassica cretica]KAF3605438.1 hypothetical protein DY000_02048040 [Brassica cretica]